MLAISLTLKRNPVMVFRGHHSWPAGGSDDQIGFPVINPRGTQLLLCSLDQLFWYLESHGQNPFPSAFFTDGGPHPLGDSFNESLS